MRGYENEATPTEQFLIYEEWDVSWPRNVVIPIPTELFRPKIDERGTF